MYKMAMETEIEAINVTKNVDFLLSQLLWLLLVLSAQFSKTAAHIEPLLGTISQGHSPPG